MRYGIITGERIHPPGSVRKKDDRPHVMPVDTTIKTETWTKEQMDEHLQKIKGGITVAKKELTESAYMYHKDEGMSDIAIMNEYGLNQYKMTSLKKQWGKSGLTTYAHSQPEAEKERAVDEDQPVPDLDLNTEYKKVIEKLQADIAQVKDERDHYANKYDESQAALDESEKELSDVRELFVKANAQVNKYRELYNASETIREHLKEVGSE